MVFHSLGSVSLFILIFCFFPLLTWTGKYCSSCFQNTFGFLVFSEYKMGAIGQKRIKLLQNTRKPWNKQGVFVSNRLKAILSDKMALLISIFNYHVQAFNLTYSKQDSLFQRESFFLMMVENVTYISYFIAFLFAILLHFTVYVSFSLIRLCRMFSKKKKLLFIGLNVVKIWKLHWHQIFCNWNLKVYY